MNNNIPNTLIPLIGLTGPTGSGKTEVSRILNVQGLRIVEADKLSREVTAAGSPCLRELAREFSDEILNADGTLNRGRLAEIAFSDKQRTRRLNEVTHPHIIALSQRYIEQYKAQGAPAVVIDAPLLFESGMDALCDITAAVLAPPDVRMRRIMDRDGLTEQQARQRMAAQPEDEYYRLRADIIIDGSGSLEQLTEQTAAIMRITSSKKGIQYEG